MVTGAGTVRCSRSSASISFCEGKSLIDLDLSETGDKTSHVSLLRVSLQLDTNDALSVNGNGHIWDGGGPFYWVSDLGTVCFRFLTHHRTARVVLAVPVSLIL